MRASSLHETVQSLISKDGQVAVVEDENQLVVMDNAPRLELIRQTLRKVEPPRRQVRITALIYDVSLEDIERLGINWASSMKGAANAADAPSPLFSVDSVQAVPLAADAVHGAMTFMTTSDLFDLTAAVNALQTANDARLLADPNVVVLDREAANIRIVTEIPYQERTQTSEGGNIGTTALREAGITLDVTPRISADNTIRMEVTPTFSRLAGFTDSVDPQPIIDTREAKTVVRIRDGQTLIIGGLRQRSDLGTYNGIPYSTDIKLLNLGKFFRGRSTTLRESELLVFIRPEIVEYEYLGEPREATAYFTGRAILERLPVAEDDVTAIAMSPRMVTSGTIMATTPNFGQIPMKQSRAYCRATWYLRPFTRRPTSPKSNRCPPRVLVR